VRIDPGISVHRGAGQLLAARRIVVATGVGDELSDIPGVPTRGRGRSTDRCGAHRRQRRAPRCGVRCPGVWGWATP
jgi:hypothetical protein